MQGSKLVVIRFDNAGHEVFAHEFCMLGHGRLLMDVHPLFGSTFGQSPDNSIMAHDAARRMVHGTVNRIGNVFRYVQGRHQFLALPGIYQMALNP